MDTAICREVIITTLKRRGNGTENSPIRVITEVYEKDGTLIAEHDPSPDVYTGMHLIKFSQWVNKMGYNSEGLNGSRIAEFLSSQESK